MSKSKTTKTSKIQSMLSRGMKPRAIAEKLGIPVSSVYQVSYRMKNGTPKPKAKPKAKPEPVVVEVEKVQEVDMVNHPPHYTVGGIETIDFIEAKGLGYLLGNVVKYVSRAAHKGGVEDLKKAKWYLERAIG
jgi:transposase